MSIARHHIPPEMIQRIAEANLLEELAGADVQLKRAGAALVGLCPFHQEKTPSFTITPTRQRFHCFGCGVSGDVIAYQMALHGIGFTAAVYRLAQRGGIHLEGAHETAAALPTRPRPKPPTVELPRRALELPPDLCRPNAVEIRAVAGRRGLSSEGLDLAAARGLLWQATPRGSASWIVTDRERVNAQARRMDGQPWRHIGEKKAWTLPGSRAAWPIGAHEANGFPCVVLVEGGPDLLAAHHFIVAEAREADVAAVAMLGAWNPIPEDALLLLANKRVRLFPHLDLAGGQAAVRWTRQLERVGCQVDAFAFDGLRRSGGGAVGDLNDLAAVDAECFEAERAQLERILPQ